MSNSLLLKNLDGLLNGTWLVYNGACFSRYNILVPQGALCSDMMSEGKILAYFGGFVTSADVGRPVGAVEFSEGDESNV